MNKKTGFFFSFPTTTCTPMTQTKRKPDGRQCLIASKNLYKYFQRASMSHRSVFSHSKKNAPISSNVETEKKESVTNL